MDLKITNKRFYYTCFSLSVIAHLLAVIYSVGFHHYDEHYQILEFASYKLGKTPLEDLAWEYEARIRPTLQPSIAYFLYKLLSLFGVENPSYQAIFLRTLSALFSIYCSILLFQTCKDRFKRNWVLLLFFFLSVLTWYFPYLHVRFCAEVWAANFFVLAYVILSRNDKLSTTKSFLTGLLFAVSFVMKFQSGVLIAGAGLWLIFVKRERFSNVLAIIFSFAVAYFILGICVDFIFYGEWVVAPFNYFTVNILEDKTSEFGTSSWWYYLHRVFHRSFVPIGLLTILSCIYLPIKRPKNLLTWVVLPYILIHFIIGHKELRFLFPVACFVPLIVAMLFQDIADVLSEKIQARLIKPVIIIIMLFHLVLLPYGSLVPAFSATRVFNYVNDNFKNNVVVKYKDCFSCLNWYYYTTQKVEYVKIQEKLSDHPVELIDLKENEIFVSNKPVDPEIKKELSLKLVYQTSPDWTNSIFFQKIMKFGPIWYVYKNTYQ